MARDVNEDAKVLALIDQGEIARRSRLPRYQVLRDWADGRVQPQLQRDKGIVKYEDDLSINLIEPVIETQSAVLLTEMPGIVYGTPFDEYAWLGNALSDYLEHLLESQFFAETLIPATYDAQVIGFGVIKTIWDNEYYGRQPRMGRSWLRRLMGTGQGEQSNLGEIRIGLVDPIACGGDPNASSIRDAEYIFTHSLVPRRIVNEKYGLDFKEEEVKHYNERMDWQDFWNEQAGLGDQKSRKEMVGDRIELKEIWYDGARMLATVSDQQFLRGPEEAIYEFINYPHVFFYADNPRHCLFPTKAMIEKIGPIHDRVNMLARQITKNADLTGNPKIQIWGMGVEGNAAKLDTPGAILEWYPDEKGAAYLIPPPMPPYIREFESHLIEMLQFVAGIEDPMIGRQSPGITAGVAIAQLQEKGHARTLMRRELFHASLKRMAENILGIAGQFLNPMHQDCADRERIIRFIRPADAPDGIDNLPWPDMPWSYVFEAQVEEVSNFAVSRVHKAEQYLRLGEAGLIPPEFVLEGMGLPKREPMIAKLKQMFEMQQQQMAMQQGGQPGMGNRSQMGQQAALPQGGNGGMAAGIDPQALAMMVRGQQGVG